MTFLVSCTLRCFGPTFAGSDLITIGANSSAKPCASRARSELRAVAFVSTGDTGLVIELAKLMLVPLLPNERNDFLPLLDDRTLDSDTSDIALADVDDLDLLVGAVADLI